MDPKVENKSKKFVQGALQLASLVIGFFGVIILLFSAWMLFFSFRNYREFVLDSWFIWVSTIFGGVLIFMSCMGYAAGSTRRRSLLSCYVAAKILLLLVEVLVTADVYLNDQWEKDLPGDPTQRFDGFIAFVEKHTQAFRILYIVLMATQGSALFLAMILRALFSRTQGDLDYAEATHEPFLNKHHIVAFPYAIGHPHDVDDTAKMDKEAMPYTEKDLWWMAGKKCPPF